MTDVNNRNAFEEKVNCLRKNRNIRDLTVVLVDLNNLKSINDTYGHYTGDEALKTIAMLLKKTIGEQADIYRIGGDEFVCFATENILDRIAQFCDNVSFENKSLT